MGLSIQEASELFSALGEPTRLRLLSLIVHNGETCVCDLMEATGIPQTNVSRHLATLRHAGFITGRKQGLWVYYSLVQGENALITQLVRLVKKAMESVPVLAVDLEKLKASCCEPEGQKPLSIALPKSTRNGKR